MDPFALRVLAQLPIGIEWIIILVVVAIVLLLGPRKIPELARGIGKALGEFRRGRQEIEREIQQEMSRTSSPPPASTPTEQVYELNPRIVQAAQRLGVDTTGRKERELKLEILGSMREAPRTRLEAIASSLDVTADGLDDLQLRDAIAKALGI